MSEITTTALICGECGRGTYRRTAYAAPVERDYWTCRECHHTIFPASDVLSNLDEGERLVTVMLPGRVPALGVVSTDTTEED